MSEKLRIRKGVQALREFWDGRRVNLVRVFSRLTDGELGEVDRRSTLNRKRRYQYRSK